MSFGSASTVDVLRCSQKDEQFTDLYASYISNIARLCSIKFQNKVTSTIQPLAQFLYYSLTSLSKFQTLGEEYTGSIRFVKSQNNIPNRWIQILWLFLFINGNNLFDKSVSHFEKKIRTNKTLTPTARASLLNWLNFVISNKYLLTRFNQTIFYMNGKYYYISNRFTKIQYILTRSWIGDNSASKPLKVLGQVSLLYLSYISLNKLYNLKNTEPPAVDTETSEICSCPTQNCFLCNEIRSNPSILTCGHVFCWKCIFDAFKKSNKCPVCRELVRYNDVILLQNY